MPLLKAGSRGIFEVLPTLQHGLPLLLQVAPTLPFHSPQKGAVTAFGTVQSHEESSLHKGLTQHTAHRKMSAWEPHGRIHRASITQYPGEARLHGSKEQPCAGKLTWCLSLPCACC